MSTRPIFVVGSGRSGTTLLYDLLVGHPDLAWISRLTDAFPKLPQLSLFSRFQWSRSWRGFQPSTDSLNVYRYCGFDSALQQKRASLNEDDATMVSVACFRRIVEQHMKWMRRPRFINKNTSNTMRIRLLHHIFPDACFVHIIRNGYAVARSLMRVEWWPQAEIWWGDTTPSQWADDGGDPLELCALNWRRQVTEILENKAHIPPAQYIECRYEDLVSNTKAVLSRLVEFCGLPLGPEFRAHLNRVRIDAGNKDAWRAQLDESARKVISRAAGDLLADLGYETY